MKELIEINKCDDLRTYIQDWLIENTEIDPDKSELLAECFVEDLAKRGYEIK